MTAALPPPSRRLPASSSGQLPRRRGHHQRGARGTGQVGGGEPGAPPMVAHDAGDRHRAHPEPSTSSDSGNPAAAGLPVRCSASSAPDVPPAARPNAPSSWAMTSTRIVRRCSNGRVGESGGAGTAAPPDWLRVEVD